MIADDKTEEQLEVEAAEWFTTMHSGEINRETRDRFEAWLHGDRAHKIAYKEFEQVYRDLDLVASEAGVDLDEALDRKQQQWLSLVPAWMRKPAIRGGAITASVLFLVVAVTTTIGVRSTQENRFAGPTLATDIAEIREHVLDDGSVVTLGAKSRIGTNFTETARTVTLLEGEAFFEVTKDPNRPFFVASQDTLIRVVGTKFDVKRSAEVIHVSVLEGVVEVMKPNNIYRTIESVDTSNVAKQVLTAGERVSSARRVALPQVQQVEQAEPGAWRKGRLAYEDASLAEIVADVNRYYDRPIRIASADVGDLRSTVAFQTSEIDQMFEVMAAIHPIIVDIPPSGEIVIRRKR